MSIDAKWLSTILRANVWQCAALALAAGLITFGHLIGLTPLEALPNAARLLAFVALIIFGSLTIFAVAKNAAPVVGTAVQRRREKRAHDDAINKMVGMLDSLSEAEHEILSYLVTNKQQYFTAMQDGERAITLLTKGIVILAAKYGQIISVWDCPFKVRDEIWDVLLSRADEFKHRDRTERRHPWRSGW